MAYPQPAGMYKQPQWGGGQYNWGGGYGAQSGSGGRAAPSWYQGGGGDYSQNPAYRNSYGGGYHNANPVPAAPAANPAAPATPAVPAASPATPAVPATPPYTGPTSPGGAPWNPDFVNANPMNLANPLSQALGGPDWLGRMPGPYGVRHEQGRDGGPLWSSPGVQVNMTGGPWSAPTTTWGDPSQYIMGPQGTHYTPTDATDAARYMQELINGGQISGITPGAPFTGFA